MLERVTSLIADGGSRTVDRDDIRTNLLDSYDRLIAFGEKHLNAPFYLEGMQWVSLRSHILREIVRARRIRCDTRGRRGVIRKTI